MIYVICLLLKFLKYLQIINEDPRFSCPLPRSILRNFNEKSPVDVDALAAAESENRKEIVPISEQVNILLL